MEFNLRVDKGKTKNDVEWDSKKGDKKIDISEVILVGVGDDADVEIKLTGSQDKLDEFLNLKNAIMKLTIEKAI